MNCYFIYYECYFYVKGKGWEREDGCYFNEDIYVSRELYSSIIGKVYEGDVGEILIVF